MYFTSTAADAAKSAAITASKTLHISERAYLTADNVQLNSSTGVVTIFFNNSGRMPSGEVEIILHNATFNAEANEFPTSTNMVDKSWKRHRPASFAPGPRVDLAIPIKQYSRTRMEKGRQIIMLAGRIIYNDGFPDDPRQEWPFCFQTTFHFIVNQLLWYPCDARLTLPDLEKLDGYPNNESH